MLRISALVRPTRSAIKPNRTPPIPEASRVKVPSHPATDLLMPNAVITWAMTRLYSITSKASRAQPSAAAISVRFCADVTSDMRKVVVAIGVHSTSVGEHPPRSTEARKDLIISDLVICLDLLRLISDHQEHLKLRRNYTITKLLNY